MIDSSLSHYLSIKEQEFNQAILVFPTVAIVAIKGKEINSFYKKFKEHIIYHATDAVFNYFVHGAIAVSKISDIINSEGSTESSTVFKIRGCNGYFILRPEHYQIWGTYIAACNEYDEAEKKLNDFATLNAKRKAELENELVLQFLQLQSNRSLKEQLDSFGFDYSTCDAVNKLHAQLRGYEIQEDEKSKESALNIKQFYNTYAKVELNLTQFLETNPTPDGMSSTLTKLDSIKNENKRLNTNKTLIGGKISDLRESITADISYFFQTDESVEEYLQAETFLDNSNGFKLVPADKLQKEKPIILQLPINELSKKSIIIPLNDSLSSYILNAYRSNFTLNHLSCQTSNAGNYQLISNSIYPISKDEETGLQVYRCNLSIPIIGSCILEIYFSNVGFDPVLLLSIDHSFKTEPERNQDNQTNTYDKSNSFTFSDINGIIYKTNLTCSFNIEDNFDTNITGYSLKVTLGVKNLNTNNEISILLVQDNFSVSNHVKFGSDILK
jgi:hypothetical protein